MIIVIFCFRNSHAFITIICTTRRSPERRRKNLVNSSAHLRDCFMNELSMMLFAYQQACDLNNRNITNDCILWSGWSDNDNQWEMKSKILELERLLNCCNINSIQKSLLKCFVLRWKSSFTHFVFEIIHYFCEINRKISVWKISHTSDDSFSFLSSFVMLWKVLNRITFKYASSELKNIFIFKWISNNNKTKNHFFAALSRYF